MKGVGSTIRPRERVSNTNFNQPKNAKRTVASNITKLQMHRIREKLNYTLARLSSGSATSISFAKPVVTICFDDAPQSAGDTGARVLEAYGARATFYVSGKLSLEDSGSYLSPSAIARLHDAGHEIACHTYSHVAVSLLTESQLCDELEQNAKYLVQYCSDEIPTNFAYPFGCVNAASKTCLQRHFRSCRTTRPGINTGSVDMALLKSVTMKILERPGKLEAYYDQIANSNSWLILYTHHVLDDPSEFGTSIKNLHHCLQAAKQRGFEILSIKAALDSNLQKDTPRCHERE